MTINSLSPGYCKLHYQTQGRRHSATIPVKYSGVPVPGEDCTLMAKGGGTVDGSVAIAALVAVLCPLYNGDSSFTSAEFWHMATPDSDPVYLEGDVFAGANGTSSTSTQLYGQVTFSFRTTLGGLARIFLMESVTSANAIWTGPSYQSAEFLALITYLLGNTSWVVGRDGGFLQYCIRGVSKKNDALRKRYLLGA